jgi:hypothetical protein
MPCDSSLSQLVRCAAAISSSCAASILSDDYAQCAVTPREARDCFLRNNQNQLDSFRAWAGDLRRGIELGAVELPDR